MSLLSKLRRRDEREMPFLEHLEELRKVLLASLGGIAICGIAVYAFSGVVIDWIVVQHVGSAQFIRPMEAFMARVKISLLLGLIVSLPFVMFQIWNFIVPGLMQHERRIVLPAAFFSTILFLGGVAFSYFVLTPIMVGLLTTGFSTEHVVANITVDYLLDFIIKLAVACGILFQLPLVVGILTLIDMVTPQFLWSKWRHAVVIILILAAVATPGDGPSQLILAAPIVVLYFLSILLSMFLVRGSEKRRKVREEEEAARADEGGMSAGPGTGGGPSLAPGAATGSTAASELGAGSAAAPTPVEDVPSSSNRIGGSEERTVPRRGSIRPPDPSVETKSIDPAIRTSSPIDSQTQPGDASARNTQSGDSSGPPTGAGESSAPASSPPDPSPSAGGEPR
jgi:sec-independent protein translocase protein TatC